jgi:5'-nucleotidase
VITFYSATVGSAREAAFSGIPAVSFNQESGPKMDYSAAAEFAVSLVQTLAKSPLRSGVYLNVNIPNLPKGAIKGYLVVPVDPQAPSEGFERRMAPDGKTYYMNTYKPLAAGTEKTDVWAVRNGYIAISPLSVDQTDRAGIESLESLIIKGWK